MHWGWIIIGGFSLVGALAWYILASINPRDDDPDPDWSQDDPRIIELCERQRRARASHRARSHLTREARSIRTERLRKQYGRV